MKIFKMIYIIFGIVITSYICFCINNFSLAKIEGDQPYLGSDGQVKGGYSYTPDDDSSGETSSDLTFSSDDQKTIYSSNTTMNTIGGKIFGVVQYVCYAVAFAIILVKGVQFMAAAPEEKADIKKEMIYIVVGAVILFAIGTIVKIIGTVVQKTF